MEILVVPILRQSGIDRSYYFHNGGWEPMGLPVEIANENRLTNPHKTRPAVVVMLLFLTRLVCKNFLLAIWPQ